MPQIRLVFFFVRNSILSTMRASLLFSLTSALLGGVAAEAQVTFVGSQIGLADSTWSSPTGIAIDGKGNLFIADRGNNRIVELSPAGSGFAPPVTVLSGLSSPAGVAADWSGNVYVSDTGDSRILMLPATPAGFGAPLTVASGLSNPNGLAVDPVGNLFVAETGSSSVIELPLLAGVYASPVTIGTGFRNPMAVAVDPNRNIFVADTGNKRITKILLSASGYLTQQSFWTGAFTPVAVFEDKNSDLFIADSQSKRILEMPWAAGGNRYASEVVIGSGFQSPAGVVTDFAGNVYVTDSTTNELSQVVNRSALFGPASVGSSAASLTYNFNVSAGTTVGAVSIYTQGVSGKDFVDAGGSSCVAQTFTAATLCGVNVAFTPQGSGIRIGAVELFDPFGNSLATAFISGVGLEPLAAFIPGSATALGTQLSGPSGVAVDGNGDLFIADTGNNRVVELPWTGSGYDAQSALPVNGLISPMGVATDGAGNLFIASNGNDKVVKLPWTPAGFGPQSRAGSGYYGPTGVTADLFGNVYVSDTLNRMVRKLIWSGNTYLTGTELGNYHKSPTGIAVDGSGNVYFSDPYQDRLSEVAWNGSGYLIEFNIPLTNVAFPTAIAVDGNSNLFVLDSVNNQVVMLPWMGTEFGPQITVATGFNAPSGLAVDASENLYVADTGNNQVVKIALSVPAAMNFANTYLGSTSSDSARVEVVTNVGNLNLSIDSVSYPPDFPQDAGASNPCTENMTLGIDQGCEIAVDFTPLAAATTSNEAVTITDNSQDVAGAQQTIAVTGTSLAKSAQTISLPSIASVVYGAKPLVISAAASSGLPVSLTVVSGPGTLLRDGKTLSVTGVGAIVIQASQPGNSGYAAAQPVTTSVSVAPAILTVTPQNITAVYGAIPSAFRYSIAGFVNGDNSTVVSGSAVIASAASTTSGVGTYALTAAPGTLSAANYTFAFAAGTLTVNKAVLQVAAVPVTRTYGSPTQPLAFRLSGFVNGDSSSVVTGTPLLTCVVNSGSRVGSYPILASPGSLAAANYNFTVVGASVNVLPAVLTVAASNESAVYGSAIPALGYSISGFVNGDTGDSVVRGTPSIAANAPAQSGALSNSGSYTISASLGTLAASNYVFKFSSGRLSVLKAVVLVTPANVSVTYGTPLPALAASLSGFVNGDTQSTAVSGTPSLATSARSGSAAGSYPILAAAGTLASNNYSFSFAAATVTIGKAVLTVTPRPVTMIYGSALPALGCTYSGFANGDGVSSLHGAPQLSTVALSSSPVGQYSINVAPGTLSASNYNFQFTPGSITVAPAVLTVAANSLAVQAGSAMPPLTYSAKGLVNGDTLSSATAGVPSLSTNATMSQTGTYPIVAAKGTMAASNYQLAFANGTLTVTK